MPPLWQPSPDRVRASHLTRLTDEIQRAGRRRIGSYDDLHRWSVGDPAAFWSALWDYTRVIGSKGDRAVTDLERLPGARFFPDGHLNFAENLLRRDDDRTAIVAVTERGLDRRMTFR